MFGPTIPDQHAKTRKIHVSKQLILKKIFRTHQLPKKQKKHTVGQQRRKLSILDGHQVAWFLDYVRILRVVSTVEDIYNYKAETCKHNNVCIKCAEKGHNKENCQCTNYKYLNCIGPNKNNNKCNFDINHSIYDVKNHHAYCKIFDIQKQKVGSTFAQKILSFVQNVQCISNKIQLIGTNLLLNYIDISCFTEHWLKKDHVETIYVDNHTLITSF